MVAGCNHRLNVELDLKSLFGLHSCTLWPRPARPQPPPPPPRPQHLGSYTRARYWSANIDDISL